MTSGAVRIIARLIAGTTVRLNLAPPSVSPRKRTYAFGHSHLVPMHIAGRFIGCVTLDFGDQESRLALGEEDMALVQAVAKLAALVTERDRLLADHQAREEAEARLAMLQTVLDELPSAVYLARGARRRAGALEPAGKGDLGRRVA
jgi:GAF domain-containing protein